MKNFEIIGFDKKEVKKLIKNEKKFNLNVTGVSSRDIIELDITINVKKNKLKLNLKCPACEEQVYSSNKSAKDLKNCIRELLSSQYN